MRFAAFDHLEPVRHPSAAVGCARAWAFPGDEEAFDKDQEPAELVLVEAPQLGEQPSVQRHSATLCERARAGPELGLKGPSCGCDVAVSGAGRRPDIDRT